MLGLRCGMWRRRGKICDCFLVEDGEEQILERKLLLYSNGEWLLGTVPVCTLTTEDKVETLFRAYDLQQAERDVLLAGR